MAVSAEVATLFLEELARRNIPVRANDEGGYVLERDGLTLTIHLDNLSRDYDSDRDAGRIVRFVDACTTRPELPPWKEAQARIRWQAETTDNTLGDTIVEKVSDQVVRALVHVDPTEMHIIWLTPDLIKRWRKTPEDLWAVAAGNMARIVSETTLDVTTEDEHKVGMLSTQLTGFKAALLFSPRLKNLVEPHLGWPVLAVAPCRDFVYLFSPKANELFGKIGSITVQQYSEGAYPLSTQVFEISDNGIKAIGEFQRPPQAQDEDEPQEGMKTIRYRGGVVTFRIPAHWQEEYEEDGGGTFYDEDGSGTLRLNIILASSKAPVTTHMARAILDSRQEPGRGEVIDLGRGKFMLSYLHEAEEDGEPMTWRFWEIAHPIPPKHLRVAIFSFAYPQDLADDEEILEQLALLDREIRACEFAAEVGS